RGDGAGRRQRASRRPPRAGAVERSRWRRPSRNGAQRHLPRTGDALLHGQRRWNAARLRPERGRRRLDGRRQRALRMGHRGRSAGQSGAGMRGVRNIWAWALLAPPLAVATVLFVVPLLYLFYISVHAASPSEIYGSTVTLENYTSV